MVALRPELSLLDKYSTLTIMILLKQGRIFQLSLRSAAFCCSPSRFLHLAALSDVFCSQLHSAELS